MSEQAAREQEARRRSMLPGGPRDAFIAAAKWGFPVASTILLAILVVLPLSATQEFSFLLSKDSAAKAGERMRMCLRRGHAFIRPAIAADGHVAPIVAGLFGGFGPVFRHDHASQSR